MNVMFDALTHLYEHLGACDSSIEQGQVEGSASLLVLEVDELWDGCGPESLRNERERERERTRRQRLRRIR